MLFRWPRGRYNGKRIGGFTITFTLDLLWWEWYPKLGNRYSRHLHWLCFHVWVEPRYALHD